MEKIKRLVPKVLKTYMGNSMLVYSGNATLFIITAAFPFVMLIISIVNLLPWYSPEDVTEFFFRLLPNLSSIRALVSGMITNLKNQSGGLLTSVAAVTTLWSASGGVNAIRLGLEKLDGGAAKIGWRMLLQRVGFTLILVILIPALLGFNLLGNSILDVIHDIFEAIGLGELESTIRSVFEASKLIVPIVSGLVALLIYAYLPSHRHTLKSRLPGAVFTGVGWFIFTELFSFFIPRFYRASSLYGSLASLFLALLWVRVIMMILFAGGALNTVLEDEAGKAGELS